MPELVGTTYYEMFVRAGSGWFAFAALIIFIHDRRSYEFRTPGAIGVQVLSFGLFWYSTVSTFSSLSLLAKAHGVLPWWYVPKFVSAEVWFYLMLGDVIVNMSIGCIALACRLNASTRKGRRYLRGKLE